MSHINSDTVYVFKSIHNGIHNLLKKYNEEQNVTEADLIQELEDIKETCGNMITYWNSHLGR